MLQRLRDAAPGDQLAAVNRFVNRLPYMPDLSNYGVSDYWAAPTEFMARGGDCEDYALAKYLSLRALGFAAADLRIVALRDAPQDLYHAVLAARLHGRWLLLDNATPRILAIEAADGREPVYAANESGWWTGRS